MAKLHEDREKMRRFMNRANMERRGTAKNAKYANPESLRRKGLNFSRVSRVSRFKDFISLDEGASVDEFLAWFPGVDRDQVHTAHLTNV